MFNSSAEHPTEEILRLVKVAAPAKTLPKELGHRSAWLFLAEATRDRPPDLPPPQAKSAVMNTLDVIQPPAKQELRNNLESSLKLLL